jgi:hypothetical protein
VRTCRPRSHPTSRAPTQSSALADLQLAELERVLHAHEAVRPIDMGRVGDLERVEVGLASLVAFLSGK